MLGCVGDVRGGAASGSGSVAAPFHRGDPGIDQLDPFTMYHVATDLRHPHARGVAGHAVGQDRLGGLARHDRSEEHTSELQSLMRISYAVFCLKKKKTKKK